MPVSLVNQTPAVLSQERTSACHRKRALGRAQLRLPQGSRFQGAAVMRMLCVMGKTPPETRMIGKVFDILYVTVLFIILTRAVF